MIRGDGPGFDVVTDALLEKSWFADSVEAADAAIQRQTASIILTRLLRLAADVAAATDVRARSASRSARRVL